VLIFILWRSVRKTEKITILVDNIPLSLLCLKKRGQLEHAYSGTWKCLNRTTLYPTKIRFFDKKDPKLSLSELLSWMTIFKSIHMGFYVNTSWACALFRNNKQHVVLGQKRKCQRVQESGLWRIQRERWIEVNNIYRKLS
jgi:hypothetical protein